MSEIKTHNVVSVHVVKEGVRLYATECLNLPSDIEAETRRVQEWAAWNEFVHQLLLAASMQAHDYTYSITPHSRQELARFLGPYLKTVNYLEAVKLVTSCIQQVVASKALFEGTAPIGPQADGLQIRYTRKLKDDEVSYHTVVLCHRWSEHAWSFIERVVHNQINGVNSFVLQRDPVPI